jgi:hypothetical protein
MKKQAREAESAARAKEAAEAKAAEAARVKAEQEAKTAAEAARVKAEQEAKANEDGEQFFYCVFLDGHGEGLSALLSDALGAQISRRPSRRAYTADRRWRNLSSLFGRPGLRNASRPSDSAAHHAAHSGLKKGWLVGTQTLPGNRR